MSTLAFALTASTYLLQARHSRGSSWDASSARSCGRASASIADWQMYELSLAAFSAVAAAAGDLRRSRTGRAMIAVRDNEAAADGGDLAHPGEARRLRHRGPWPGSPARLYLLSQNGLHPDAFTPDVSLRLFSMVVIGGLCSLSGGARPRRRLRQGAEFFLPARLVADRQRGGIVALLLTVPGGLGEVLSHAREAFLRGVARRRGITAQLHDRLCR